jgi:SAM-dependent methyltransferase
MIGTDADAIFDVGCGDGRLLDIFKKKNKSKGEYYGIELIGDAACRARAKGYTVYEGNIETADLSALSGKMDLVLMHQIIEHTRSPRAVIKKVNDILRDGGVVSIETPDVNSLDFKLFRKRYWGGYHIPRHFYLFTKPTLCRLLKEEGFDIVSVASILSPVFWVTSIHNMCKERFSKSTAHFFSYKNPLLLAMATLIDIAQIVFFSRSSNMQIVARKGKTL